MIRSRHFLQTFVFDSGRAGFEGLCVAVALKTLGLWESTEGQAAKSLVTNGSAALIFVRYNCTMLHSR